MQRDQDEALAAKLADGQLFVVNEVRSEVWRFTTTEGVHAALVRPDGMLYLRSPLHDPRNGSSQGMFFYRSFDRGKMERIRVYCDENGHATGDIRTNTVDGYFDDWKLENLWREL